MKEWKNYNLNWVLMPTTGKEVIEDIESGKIKNPDFFLMLNICEVLDISVFELLKDKKI